MIDAINYVRRKRAIRHGILCIRCYFNMAAPIGLSTVTSNMEKTEFLYFFKVFADIVLYFPNRKKRQCNIKLK